MSCEPIFTEPQSRPKSRCALRNSIKVLIAVFPSQVNTQPSLITVHTHKTLQECWVALNWSEKREVTELFYLSFYGQLQCDILMCGRLASQGVDVSPSLILHRYFIDTSCIYQQLLLFYLYCCLNFLWKYEQNRESFDIIIFKMVLLFYLIGSFFFQTFLETSCKMVVMRG